MQIYWIDVEGGGATLLVAPGGQTLLMDAGWGDNRGGAARVVPVLAAVGAEKLDYFVASHYHVDHLSGITTLARALDIANFIDHGSNTEGNDYGYGAAAAEGKRTAMKAGRQADAGRSRADDRQRRPPGDRAPALGKAQPAVRRRAGQDRRQRRGPAEPRLSSPASATSSSWPWAISPGASSTAWPAR